MATEQRPATAELLHMLQLATERYLSVAANPNATITALLESEIDVVETASALGGLAGSRPVGVDAVDEMTERRDARFAAFYSRVSRDLRLDEDAARTVYTTAWEACRREIFTRVARSVAMRRAESLRAETRGTT